MIEYLQKIGGYNLNGLTADEKYELEHLRKLVKQYRQMDEQENKSIDISEEEDSESEKSKKNQKKVVKKVKAKMKMILILI